MCMLMWIHLLCVCLCGLICYVHAHVDTSAIWMHLIKPILLYTTSIWFLNASISAVASLQIIQNSALRIATISLRTATVPHLHHEAEILQISPNLSLLCSQFLLRALIPDHPSHDVVTAPSGPCIVRYTLQSRFLPSVHHLLTVEFHSLLLSCQASLRSLHSIGVSYADVSLGFNRLLSEPPPPLRLTPLSNHSLGSTVPTSPN